MRFILTIDTEADNQWNHGRILDTQNIKYLPRFQSLCNRFNIKPTYLVTSEICADPIAQDLLTHFISQNAAEVGAHLHVWSTPPFKSDEGYTLNDSNHPFANELSKEFISEKIRILTDQIEASFHKRPTSFRSGRYGFSEEIAEVLVDNGYVVDSSITPYIDWSSHKGLPDGSGGPDFLRYTPKPFRYTFDNGHLLEIPITILPTKFPLNANDLLARYYFQHVKSSMLMRILKKLYFKRQPLWLRPNLWMSQNLFNDLINEARKRGLPYLVMMFHSSELMPGGSIYWKDSDDIEKLFCSLEQFFLLLESQKISSVTLTQAAKESEYENMLLG